jgi:EAL domain-containing protein (putative c-di-GMP-specific phosphodiesterase class I)
MRRVLLLDDEESVLGVLSDYLRAPGLEVITCREIEAAEAILNHYRFEVVVTDLRVSELGGLEGMRLIRYVSTHFPDTTVLAMSGYVNDDVHNLGRAVGATAILEKPLDLQRLRHYVHGDHGQFIADGADDDDDGIVQEVQPLDDFLATESIRSVLQPIVDLSREGPPFLAHGVESLARAPRGTPLRNPEILFSYASKKERLFDTDMLCIRAALREGATLGKGYKLFINVQPRSMTNPQFADQVTEMALEAGFKNEEIVFELTEQQTILNPAAFAKTLGTMRERGFGIALDDYGVGFANLRLVQDLRPEYLKLSGYFCKDIHTDEYKQMIVRATAEMCSQLNIPTILESVETAEELEVVRTLGVTHGQGYFFARPAPGNDLAKSDRFFGYDASPHGRSVDT